MKTTFKTGFAAVMLLAISCTKETINSPSSAATQLTDNALAFTVGQHYGGGIIFILITPAAWFNSQHN